MDKVFFETQNSLIGNVVLENGYTYEDIQDDISLRESELNDAFNDLLDVVFSRDYIVDESITKINTNDVKEKVLSLLSLEYPEARIYRPAIINVGNGEIIFTEFPYDEMCNKTSRTSTLKEQTKINVTVRPA